MQDITTHETQAIIGGLTSPSIYIHGHLTWNPLASVSINGVPVKPTPDC